MASTIRNEVGPVEVHTPDNAVVDKYFVHGLGGRRASTWTAANGVFWPGDLLPKDIPDARIITWGYVAAIAHFWSPASNSKVDDHARTLLEDVGTLREKIKTTERPIILVTHSLGGIVCAKGFLMVHLIGAAPTQKSWGHVKAIAFLGTPFEGADKTQWIRAAEKVSKYFPLGKFNKELPRDLEPGSQALENLSRDFLQWLHNPQQIPEDKFSVVCFYEELDSPFGEIVPHESSKLGGWLTLPIRATHTGMCKYSDEDEASYQRV